MSTVARSLKGTFVGVVNFVVQALQAIFVVPLMLRGWGADQYATWLVCQAGLTMLLTLEAGHQLYVGNELNKSLPVDRHATRCLLGSALRFSVVLTAIEIIVVAVLWATNSVHFLLGLDQAQVKQQSLDAALFVLVASSLPFGAAGGIVARLYPPAGRFARAAIWSSIHKLVVATTSTVAAILQLNLFRTSVWLALATMVFTGLCLADGRRIFKDFVPFLATGDLRNGWRNFCRSLSVTGMIVMGQLQNSGTILFVSSVLGTSATASFATIRTLSNAALQAAALVFAPAVPEFVRFHVRGELEKVRIGIFGLAVATSSAAALCALLFAIVAQPLYQLWTRHEVPFNIPVFNIIVASALWRIAGYPLTNHMMAMNDPKWISLSSVAQTLILVVCSTVSAPLLGVVGVSLAILLSEVVGAYVIPSLWVVRKLPACDGRAFLVDHIVAASIPAQSSVSLLLAASAPQLRTPILLTGALLSLFLMVLLLRRVPTETRKSVLHAAFRILD